MSSLAFLVSELQASLQGLQAPRTDVISSLWRARRAVSIQKFARCVSRPARYISHIDPQVRPQRSRFQSCAARQTRPAIRLQMVRPSSSRRRALTRSRWSSIRRAPAPRLHGLRDQEPQDCRHISGLSTASHWLQGSPTKRGAADRRDHERMREPGRRHPAQNSPDHPRSRHQLPFRARRPAGRCAFHTRRATWC